MHVCVCVARPTYVILYVDDKSSASPYVVSSIVFQYVGCLFLYTCLSLCQTVRMLVCLTMACMLVRVKEGLYRIKILCRRHQF